eukprot:TRINITY_DN37853_c0_g1_i1.p1 TRINITY_DN37853_c0_g1~~TRINITY_DN37853_c0_g1_i1.p1  ORF type:complete len:371 (+),score=145.81 TRINITY_DN37853_c0_g1_i1:42-1115(+)
MADQLVEILGISRTQAQSLLDISGGDVQSAMNLYLQTQSSPAPTTGGARTSAAAAPPPALSSSSAAPQAAPVLQEEAIDVDEDEYTIKEPGKTIRVRAVAPNGQHDMSIDEGMPVGMFMKEVGLKSDIPSNCVKILMGFPPKALEVDDRWRTLKDLGVKSGERLTIQKGEAKVMKGVTKGKYIPPTDSKNSFTKREMPGDNSCLFHACNYVLNNKTRCDPTEMRNKIAEIVLSNPAKYTTEFLGQPNAYYAEWIKHKDNWGGAIELSILSFLYQTEIVALDVQTTRWHQFGEDENYSTRCFILYSGRHYDAMAMAEYGGASDANDKVLFSTTDKNVFKKALDFIAMEHKRALANPGN